MTVESILLLLTVVTGMVDVVSFLALGRVFTANMTGNIVLLGFAVAATPGVSIKRSCTAMFAFLGGASIGGRMSLGKSTAPAALAFGTEALLLLMAGSIAFILSGTLRLYSVIAITAVAMGIRNVAVRKLAIPDLTTTVLTLTITGLASESILAGGSNQRLGRGSAAILAMGGGAAMGARMLAFSMALPLCVGGITVGTCAFAMFRIESKGSE
jgi:uncharacterized membrane protein YoaK (UPF0700 family)